MKPKRLLGWVMKGGAAMQIIAEMRIQWDFVKPRLDKLASEDPEIASFLGNVRALMSLFHGARP